MNKRGEGDEGHWGIIVGAIIILIVIFATFFIYSDAFAKLKEGFKVVADEETIKKAYSETIGKESRLTEEEGKIIDQFNLFFQKNFAADDDGCIKKIDFAPIKGKGFGIRVKDGDVFAEKEDKARVYPIFVPSKLALYFDENANEFSIDERFEKINNEFEFMNVVYVKEEDKEKRINFLDKETAADFSGWYSDVIKMRTCGDKKERKNVVKKVEGDELILNYLNKEFSYSQQKYTMFELIVHLNELKKSLLENLAYEIYNKWRGVWKTYTTDYFVGQGYENPEGCLLLSISDGESFSYGNAEITPLGEKIGGARITLADDSVLKLELRSSPMISCQT